MNHRILSAAITTLLLLGLCAPSALAHGGQFRGPGGQVPPGMREPSDPTPPPPPSPTPTPTPDPTTPDVTGPSIPKTPETSPTPNTPNQPSSSPNRPTRRASGMDFTDASFWWGYNKAPYLMLKEAIYHNTTSENPLQMLGRGAGNTGDNMHDIRGMVRSTILPTLMWVMDPKRDLHEDIESAAYIGLGKIATEPAHIEMLKKGLALSSKAKKPIMVQEAAALSFGLLRRTKESEQFTGTELDRVREYLFDVFGNKDYGIRVRGFAALSVGLLGDQPAGHTAEGSTDGGSAATARLFELLAEGYTSADLNVALLMAIGMQDARSVTDGQREILRQMVLRGRIERREVDALLRAFAAHTLGRIGTARDINVLQRASRLRVGKDDRLSRSAAIGLGELSRLVGGADRVDLAEGLISMLGKRTRDASTRHFAYISLGYVIRDDVKSRRADVIEHTKAADLLIEAATKGKKGDRNYAGMALAVVAREIGETPPVDAYGDLRSKIFEVLGAGISSKRFTKRERANYAIAVGMAGATTHANTLLDIVKDKDESHELRGYSALALGLLKDSRTSVIKAVRQALKDRRSEEMRIQCATALGLLHDRDAVPLLLEELEQSRSLSAKAQVVLALARIGDERSVDPLVAIVRSEKRKEQAYTRAVACAALGIVGDLEPVPSLSRISINVNYRASTDLTREVLSIL
ncbi:MAG: HEAT repeat domain-containing protein [Planctomycetota bacterium]|nr:HEAT repeat domain-containing protein [Planctomycetota bacterium]